MIYRLLADLVVLLHLAFIAFAIAGGLFALYRWWLSFLHLPASIWAVFVEVSGGYCPLTPLENELRRLSGAAGYPSGFVEHYLLPIIYPTRLTFRVRFVLALLVVLANLIVYGLAAHYWVARKRKRAA